MVSAVTLSLHKKMTAFVIISFSLTHKKLNFNYYCALVLCYLAICFLFAILPGVPWWSRLCDCLYRTELESTTTRYHDSQP